MKKIFNIKKNFENQKKNFENFEKNQKKIFENQKKKIVSHENLLKTLSQFIRLTLSCLIEYTQSKALKPIEQLDSLKKNFQ